MKKEKEKFNNPENDGFKLGIIIVAILMFLYSIWQCFKELDPKEEKKTIPKNNIFGYYGVDKKTFAKWIEFFTDDDFNKNYKYSRKFKESEFLKIKELFGCENEKNKLVYSKGDICDEWCITYNTLSTNFMKYTKIHDKISIKAFRSLNYFPKNITLQIVDCLSYSNEESL